MGDINNAQLVDAAHEAIRTNDLAPIAQLLQDNQDTHGEYFLQVTRVERQQVPAASLLGRVTKEKLAVITTKLAQTELAYKRC